jgi:hypothetical protein
MARICTFANASVLGFMIPPQAFHEICIFPCEKRNAVNTLYQQLGQTPFDILRSCFQWCGVNIFAVVKGKGSYYTFLEFFKGKRGKKYSVTRPKIHCCINFGFFAKLCHFSANI